MPTKKKVPAVKEPEMVVHHVGKLLIIDENVCENTFISIELTKGLIEKVYKYQEGIRYMKSLGLNPYSVKSFDYNFALVEAAPIKRSEKDIIVFASKEDKETWEDLSDGEDEVSFEEMSSGVREDSALLNVKERGMYYSMHMKHCSIQMESHEITNAELKEIYIKLGGIP